MRFTVLRASKLFHMLTKVYLSDLTAHCSGKIHRSFGRAIKTTRNLRGLKGFETEADTNLVGQTIRAEVMHTNFMIHYKISFPYC